MNAPTVSVYIHSGNLNSLMRGSSVRFINNLRDREYVYDYFILVTLPADKVSFENDYITYTA